jgi:hypothetical protein
MSASRLSSTVFSSARTEAPGHPDPVQKNSNEKCEAQRRGSYQEHVVEKDSKCAVDEQVTKVAGPKASLMKIVASERSGSGLMLDTDGD